MIGSKLKRNQQDKMSDKPPVVPKGKLGSPSNSQDFGTGQEFNGDLRSKCDVNNSIYRVPLSPEAKRKSASGLLRTNSSENVDKSKPKLAIGFSTIPRIQGAHVLQKIQEELKPHELIPYDPNLYNSTSSILDNSQLKESKPNPETPKLVHLFPSGSKKSSVISFGKNFFRLKRNKRSSSAPELGLEVYYYYFLIHYYC